MAIRVVGWQPQPGQPLPLPIIEDDRASLPTYLVKQAADYLAAERVKWLHRHRPADQVLSLSGIDSRAVDNSGSWSEVHFHDNGTVRQEAMRYGAYSSVELEPGTAAIPLKSKGILLGTYHFLIARDSRNGLTICGDLLWFQPAGGPLSNVDLRDKAALV